MPPLFSRRGANAFTALVCISLIAVAYFYMENYLFLTPCPLCYAQRIVFVFIAVICLIAIVQPHGHTGGIIYGIILFFISAGGAALSIRHLYLQSQPKGTLSACGEDFYALLENTPLKTLVQTMLTGSGECGDVQWKLLGISIPGWTLIAFIFIGIWCFYYNAIKRN